MSTKSFIRAISIDKKEYETNPEAFDKWTNFCYNSDNYISLWDVTDNKYPILIMSGCADSGINDEIKSFITGCKYCYGNNLYYDQEYNAIICNDVSNPEIEPYFANVITLD